MAALGLEVGDHGEPRPALNECISRALTTGDSLTVRALCAECFPLNYSDSWYEYVVSNKVYSLGVFAEQQLVGMVIAERQPLDQLEQELGPVLDSADPGCTIMYVISLGVRSCYRQKGVASSLMQSLMKQVSSISSCKLIYLHVLTSNAPAIKLYTKLGFEERARIVEYYHIKGQPADGYIYVYFINNGQVFSGSCHSYFRRYIIESTLVRGGTQLAHIAYNVAGWRLGQSRRLAVLKFTIVCLILCFMLCIIVEWF